MIAVYLASAQRRNIRVFIKNGHALNIVPVAYAPHDHRIKSFVNQRLTRSRGHPAGIYISRVRSDNGYDFRRYLRHKGVSKKSLHHALELVLVFGVKYAVKRRYLLALRIRNGVWQQ